MCNADNAKTWSKTKNTLSSTSELHQDVITYFTSLLTLHHFEGSLASGKSFPEIFPGEKKIHPTPPWRRPSIKGAYLEYFPGSKTWRRNNAAGRVELFVVQHCKIHILEQISGDGHQRIHLVQQVVHLRQIRRMHQIISTLHNPTDNDNELCQTHQDPLKIQMVRRITQWYKCIMD